MPQQILDLPQVRSVLQQVRRKRMPQRMARHPFLDPGLMSGPLDRLIIDLPVQMVSPPDSGLGIRRNLPRRTAAALQRLQMHAVNLAERAIA
jgi:hypothetical protein